jgi:hypothetical protein
MTISYKTEQEKDLYVRKDETTYHLYPDDTVEIHGSGMLKAVQISTRKTKKLNLFSFVGLVLVRLIVNIFNVILMSFRENWIDGLDPFVSWAYIDMELSACVVEYIPSVFFRDGRCESLPKFLVNGSEVVTHSQYDKNAVDKHFVRYCCDLFCFWGYSAVTIILIFALSGKFFDLFFVPVVIIGCLTIPLLLKLFKARREKIIFSEEVSRNRNL